MTKAVFVLLSVFGLGVVGATDLYSYYPGFSTCGTVATNQFGKRVAVNICSEPLEFHTSKKGGSTAEAMMTVNDGGISKGYPVEPGETIVAICKKNDGYDSGRRMCRGRKL